MQDTGSLLPPPLPRPRAKSRRSSSKNIISAFPYQDRRIKAAIQLLKYKNSKSLGQLLGKALQDHILEILAEEDLFAQESKKSPWLLIPIPLSQERLKTRGYNQAELIGRGLISKEEQYFIMDTTVLYKRHHTESQVSIKDRQSRLRNPKDSFGVRNPERIAKRNCMVLDDVVTTGATMSEAMRVLKKAGAKRVLGLSVAH